MLRSILSVIAGYLVMAIVVMITFSLTYLAMGAEGAFKPGSYDPSLLWIVISFVLGLIAAVLGGLVCAVIARSPRPPLVLAAVVLVLGLLLAVPVLIEDRGGEPPVRSGDLDNFEAMNSARQPLWVALLNPLVGAAGTLLGARLKRRKS